METDRLDYGLTFLEQAGLSGEQVFCKELVVFFQRLYIVEDLLYVSL